MDAKLKEGIDRELKRIEHKEDSLRSAAYRENTSKIKKTLSEKIPDNVYSALCIAFCKAFEIVFKKGTDIIEKTYKREDIEEGFDLNHCSVSRKPSKRAFDRLYQSKIRENAVNMTATTIEGIGLGLLGIGLPDIVLFIGMLLRGIYETSLQFGFDYDLAEEKYMILRIMAASLSKGKDWDEKNEDIDNLSRQRLLVSESDIREEIEKTSQVFALDMLFTKFIQGLPLIGAIGGAFNPVYYRRVIKYAQLKYKKRYLLKRSQEE